MARIDRLAPQDRALVRRASVLGISVPIKALGWVLDNDSPQPDAATWERLSEFFEQEGDGYIRFRRALLRDAAYEGLPFRLRRSLHIAAVDHLEREPGGVEEETEALSLHSYLAGRFDKAWVYGRLAGDRARDSRRSLGGGALLSTGAGCRPQDRGRLRRRGRPRGRHRGAGRDAAARR